MLICIKIGGALVKEGVDQVISDIKELSGIHQFIIVHGGGPQINEISEKMGLIPKYLMSPSGFRSRHTDPEALRIAILALAGDVNKRIVQAMAQKSIRAFGCTGCDGPILVASRKEKIMNVTPEGKRFVIRDDYSGKIENTDGGIPKYLLEKGITPVIGSLAMTEKGEIVNCDGDRAASSIAQAVGADILISLTDVEGVYKDMESKEIIPEMSRAEAENLLESLKGGMKKKVYAALEALEKGNPKVIVGSGTITSPIKSLLDRKTGTVISN